MEGVQQAHPTPTTGLVALGLSDSAPHTFVADLQGLVAAGVRVALPSPSPFGPTGKVTTLSLLHLRFACGVALYVDLPPIWESVARGKEARWMGLPPSIRP